MNDSDKRLLIGFLDDLREVLEDLVTVESEDGWIADPSLAADLREGWSQTEWAFDQVSATLILPSGPSGPERSDPFFLAGLTGFHLQMKSAAFSRAVEDLRSAQEGSAHPPEDAEDRSRPSEPRRRRPLRKQRGLFKPLKRVLRWGNLMLGSLSKVIPIAEMIKEYKDAAEIGIDQAEQR